METTRVCAVSNPAVALGSRSGAEEYRTDSYISPGRIGKLDLRSGCFSWVEVLELAAGELRRTGELSVARHAVQSGAVTVRQFLFRRFGIVTGRREYWTRSGWTPDRADAHEFLGALRRAEKANGPFRPSALA
jgi:hypothetical protein